MHIYDREESGPTMTLELPVTVVETLTEIAYRHLTPSMGLDGSFTDELRGQVADHYARVAAPPGPQKYGTVADVVTRLLEMPQDKRFVIADCGADTEWDILSIEDNDAVLASAAPDGESEWDTPTRPGVVELLIDY